ncbi:MAG TPA: NnrS family protein [Armatimonadota bacterium]|jgi:hypothetical protein
MNLLRMYPSNQTPWRPFLAAAVLTTLTAGATWGAIILIDIAAHHDFTSAGLHWVNAHGHAQIFGWIGLFVMGVSAATLPDFWGVPLSRVGWLRPALALMVAGIALRVLGEACLSGSAALWVGVAGGLSEVSALSLYLYVILDTWRRTPSAAKTPADLYVLSALAWLGAQAIFDVLYYAGTVTAPNSDALVARVATYQSPLRDWQIYGFGLLMVLGMSQRLLPALLPGFHADAERARRWLAPLNLGVLASSVGFALAMGTRHFAWMGVSYLGKVTVAVAAVMLIRGWGLWRRPFHPLLRRYLATSYAWLLVALGMGVLMPFYFVLIGHPFSHAYYGAGRHAITVGFLSVTVLGMASVLVPRLCGFLQPLEAGMTAPYILINLGCAIRVFGQIATDFTPVAFPIAGVSGCLEVTALALWAWRLAPYLAPRLAIRRLKAAPQGLKG